MASSLQVVDEEKHVEKTKETFEEVRDYLFKEVSEMELPWVPLPCYSGYFLMADISKCRSLIPDKYFESHEIDSMDDPLQPPVNKYHLYMPKEEGSEDQYIPLDLAFCRWMGRENGVTMMPGSFFYSKGSPYIDDNYIRLAICKDLKSVKLVCNRLRLINISK